MTPEERHSKIESEIDKQNEAIRGLIIVGRTCLDSIGELRETLRENAKVTMAEIRELHKETDFKLNALIEHEQALDRNINELTKLVDRIVRKDEGTEGPNV